FDRCLDLGSYRAAVEADFQTGLRLGLNSTPTFIVNGQRIVGAQPLAVFAAAFSSRTRLLLQAPLFFAGIATIVMPLGLGVGAMSELVLGERDLVIAIAGAVLVGFGLYTFAGGGFAVAPGVSGRLQAIEGRFAAYATGLAYGLAGFCSGPIFGGVLTVAATSGAAALGGALLAAFALGMTLPV